MSFCYVRRALAHVMLTKDKRDDLIIAVDGNRRRLLYLHLAHAANI